MTNQQLYLEAKALYTNLNRIPGYRTAELARKAFWRMCRRAHTAQWPNGETEDE